MTRMLSLVSIGLLAITMTACGLKSREQRTQEKADALVEEYKKLTNYFQVTTPTESMTDQELNAFEAALNRLQVVERELDDINGKDGIKIRGGKNDPQWYAMQHGRLEAARTAKLKKPR